MGNWKHRGGGTVALCAFLIGRERNASVSTQSYALPFALLPGYRPSPITHHTAHCLSTVHSMLRVHSLHCFLPNAHSSVAFSMEICINIKYTSIILILFYFKPQVERARCYVLLNIILHQQWSYDV